MKKSKYIAKTSFYDKGVKYNRGDELMLDAWQYSVLKSKVKKPIDKTDVSAKQEVSNKVNDWIFRVKEEVSKEKPQWKRLDSLLDERSLSKEGKVADKIVRLKSEVDSLSV